jgi:hypothetical protein
LEYLRIGLEAAKGGAPAILVWTMGAILGIIFMVTPSLIAARRADFAVTMAVTGVVVLVFLSWLAIKNPATLLLQYRWRVVQQPMRNEKLVGLAVQELKNVLGVACDAFDAVIPGVKNQVRANIFMPDYRHASEGIALELRMPVEFRPGMVDASEWDLAFAPGQGATGEVFLTGSPVLAINRLIGVEDDKDVFDPVIAANLKAIVSLPIADNEHANVVAVLNIDVCGDAVVGNEHLPPVYEKIRASASFQKLRESINKLDKAWLTIGLGPG